MDAPPPPDETARLARGMEREHSARLAAEAIAEQATANLYASVRALERFRAVLEATTDFVAIADAAGSPFYLNRAIAEFLGVEAGGLAPPPPFTLADLLSPASHARFVDDAWPTLGDKGAWRGELVMVDRHGTEVPVSLVLVAHRDSGGVIESVSAVARDVSEQRALQEQLAQLALHDPLTGLPNRRLLGDHLDMALARAARAATTTAVLYADLDHFKGVNDRFGHAGGDRVLVAVAHRLRAILRPTDTVARMGGDEFVVTCEGLAECDNPVQGAIVVAERVAEALEAPITLDGAEVVVTVSTGIALATGSEDPDTLLRHADAALYEAKRGGRDQYRVWPG